MKNEVVPVPHIVKRGWIQWLSTDEERRISYIAIAFAWDDTSLK
jgi:hypothetical protein